jgi:hypothetical protein
MEFDPEFPRHTGVPFGHAALDLDGTAGSVHGARELGQHAVSSGLDDVSATFGDSGIDERFPERLELASVPSSSRLIKQLSEGHRWSDHDDGICHEGQVEAGRQCRQIVGPNSCATVRHVGDVERTARHGIKKP